MPAETFEDFFEAFLLEPHLTRKRFTLLVSQGARDPRTLARQLQVALPQLEREALVAGLQLLGQLDTRAALENFRGPQLHLFAEADALVPLAPPRPCSSGCRTSRSRPWRPVTACRWNARTRWPAQS